VYNVHINTGMCIKTQEAYMKKQARRKEVMKKRMITMLLAVTMCVNLLAGCGTAVVVSVRPRVDVSPKVDVSPEVNVSPSIEQIPRDYQVHFKAIRERAWFERVEALSKSPMERLGELYNYRMHLIDAWRGINRQMEMNTLHDNDELKELRARLQ